jgi:hypothetical protein
MTYGLIFWGNSCQSNIIFRLQKKAIWIIKGITDRDSRRKHFKELKILTLKSQYIYSLSLFVINNRHNYETNSVIHNVNTRNKYDLHHPTSQLTVFQKGTYYAGIKVFNGLPAAIKQLSHKIKQFKLALKNFLLLHWTNILNTRIKFINMFQDRTSTVTCSLYIKIKPNMWLLNSLYVKVLFLYAYIMNVLYYIYL